MPLRYRLQILLVLAFMLLLGACSASIREIRSTDDSTSEPGSTATTTAEPTATETEEPAPTAVPSGSLLVIDSLPVRQVVIWDSALPAEFAATEITLFHRTDTRAWRRVGSMPARGQIIGDPQTPDVLYLGDHPPCLREGEPMPFHRSLDRGESWQEIPEAINIRPILVWPENSDIIIGSRCGLAISENRGLSWDVHLPESGFDLTRLSVTQVGLYGIFTSEREQSNLRRIHLDDPAEPKFDETILSFWGQGAVAATSERLFAAESTGVHISSDGGRNWTMTRQGLEEVTVSVNPLEEPIPDRELDAGFGLFSIATHPRDSSRIFLGTVRGLYLSEDGGQSWGRQTEINDVPVRELQFALEGAVLYATTPDGVVLLHNP